MRKFLWPRTRARTFIAIGRDLEINGLHFVDGSFGPNARRKRAFIPHELPSTVKTILTGDGEFVISLLGEKTYPKGRTIIRQNYDMVLNIGVEARLLQLGSSILQ